MNSVVKRESKVLTGTMFGRGRAATREASCNFVLFVINMNLRGANVFQSLFQLIRHYHGSYRTTRAERAACDSQGVPVPSMRNIPGFGHAELGGAAEFDIEPDNERWTFKVGPELPPVTKAERGLVPFRLDLTAAYNSHTAPPPPVPSTSSGRTGGPTPTQPPTAHFGAVG